MPIMPTLKRKLFAAATSLSAAGLFFADCAQAQQPAGAATTAIGATDAPIMAVVALSEQQITVYGADGSHQRAPISSGRAGYETPAGIYSVIQKEAEHYSNLYDDASMPFMQRITWSGIALHAGPIPGHPASHGCVRMPFGFAEQLFGVTRIGMRVVIVRDDVSPAEISHARLLKTGPIRSTAALSSEAAGDLSALRSVRLDVGNASDGATTWRSVAIVRAAAADAAANRTDEARRIAIRAGAGAAKAVKAQRRADGLRLKAEAQLMGLGSFGRAVEPLAIVPIDALRIRALARLSVVVKELAALQSEAQVQIDATLAAREQVKLAQAEWVAARHEAEVAEAKAAPISVFISRKTQHLYARQPSGPIFEAPVAIDAPDDPVGTFVFTALAPVAAAGELRWTVLALYANPTNPNLATGQRAPGRGSPTPTNTSAAKTALDRILIPREALEQISEFVSPGSSLIISDEEMSKETGKDTEFVVLLSGEPQGGIKIRHRAYSAF
jgi:hypothetical protein